MSILNRVMDSMRLTDYNEDRYEYEEEEKEEAKEVKYSVPSLFFRGQEPAVEEPMEVVMLRPSSMEDAKEISDYLLDGRTVIISVEELDSKNAPRVIDFTSGAVYCVNGTIQQVSDNIFIAAPQAVDLAGKFM